MPETIIQLQDVKKSFERQTVLDGITLSIGKGESVVIIGQSGSGKSVLLKHLMRLLDPDSGKIFFGEEDISKLHGDSLTAMRRRYGMLFQSAALFDSLTVAENVGLGLKEVGDISDVEIEAIVLEKLDLVGLADIGDKFPAELSGGMRKRVGLARAIAHNPEILLYDEPTTGLDPITSDLINDLIVHLNERLHVTSIAVTHDMTSAFKIADRIVMLYQGKIEFDGSPDQVRATSNPVVQQFIAGKSTGPIQVR